MNMYMSMALDVNPGHVQIAVVFFTCIKTREILPRTNRANATVGVARRCARKRETMELTLEKQLALAEVRKAIYDRLKNFSFTEDVLKDKSLFQLLNLLQLLLGHRNYIGIFS